MIQNVEITRGSSDNTPSVLRKFSRRVQGSGLIPHIRKHRYRIRPLSAAKKKLAALHKIAKEEERMQLIKEGKMSETPERRGRRPSFRFNRDEKKTEDTKTETKPTETKTEETEPSTEKAEEKPTSE